MKHDSPGLIEILKLFGSEAYVEELIKKEYSK